MKAQVFSPGLVLPPLCLALPCLWVAASPSEERSSLWQQISACGTCSQRGKHSATAIQAPRARCLRYRKPQCGSRRTPSGTSSMVRNLINQPSAACGIVVGLPAKPTAQARSFSFLLLGLRVIAHLNLVMWIHDPGCHPAPDSRAD